MTIKTVLDIRYKRLDGLFPVRTRITINGKQRYCATGVYKTIEEWKKEGYYPWLKNIYKIYHINVVMNGEAILPVGAGLYFLLNDAKEVVYIGSSKNISERIKDHVFRKKKDFTKCSFLELRGFSKQEIEQSENFYIQLLKPKYNLIVRL